MYIRTKRNSHSTTSLSAIINMQNLVGNEQKRHKNLICFKKQVFSTSMKTLKMESSPLEMLKNNTDFQGQT